MDVGHHNELNAQTEGHRAGNQEQEPSIQTAVVQSP